MKNRGSILIVDDNISILSALKILLTPQFLSIKTLSSPSQLITTIKDEKINVVLLDMNFNKGINNGNEGLFLLNEIKRKYGNKCEVVLITAYADIELAIKGMKSGACDFIVKPWENSTLIETLKRACLMVQQSENGTNKINLNKESKEMFWGESKSMKRLRELVNKIAETDANILIYGENGIGKEILAKEIHRLSKRNEENMVAVDMGAISETLFESELFGHTKGAFTDAKNDRIGKFELANKGTLFMDEVGNIPLHLQIKLLTVLQTRNVIRVGSNIHIEIDIRLISATNQNLEQMINNGSFRMDLMYRMNTITLKLAPLRERKEDIIPLANIFIEKYNAQYNKKIVGICPDARGVLESYRWRGNIRELQHTIEKAVIICTSQLLKEEDFILDNNSIIENRIENSDVTTIEDMERQMIENTIIKYSSNLSMVASSLGISRQTLYNKMKRYNI